MNLRESAKEAGLENKFLKFSSFVSAVSEATRTLGATVVQEFKVNRHLFYWLIISQVFCVMMCLLYFYYQNELEILPSWQISLLMLISSVINIEAVWLVSKIGQRFKAVALLPILVGLTGMLYILAITKLPLIYMIIYVLADGLYAQSLIMPFK
nr:hypothetical protein [Streptococcus gallolyticus]